MSPKTNRNKKRVGGRGGCYRGAPRADKVRAVCHIQTAAAAYKILNEIEITLIVCAGPKTTTNGNNNWHACV